MNLSRNQPKKMIKSYFILSVATLNIICFTVKINIFLRFCLCTFENDTVKSDCPVQKTPDLRPLPVGFVCLI